MSEDLKVKFMEFTKCSNEEADTFLEAANNDIDQAINLFFASSSERPKHQETGVSTLFSASKSKESKREEDGQTFYVGGSEGGGGQQVIAPKKDKKEFVSSIFSAAKEQGAEVLDSTTYKKDEKFKAFTGGAYVLGDDVNKPSQSLAKDSDDEEENEEEFIVKLWSDGFSLNDGPLRTFEDPASMEFLSSIRTGNIPRELLSKVSGKRVNLLLEDHKEENYKAPEKKLKAFSGTGTRLGHPETSFMPAVNVEIPTDCVPVDSTKPKTKIQVRLISGKRLVLELNHDHKISSIRQEVLRQDTSSRTVNFQLFSAHPMKLLDESISLEEASLLNSVVIQKQC